jgi:hypothetical protein
MNNNFLGQVDPNQVPGIQMAIIRQCAIKQKADLAKKGAETHEIRNAVQAFVRRTKALKENPPI